MRLVASDNLNENYTTIVIHVNDVNDNPPVFDRPTYETQITEEDDRMLPKRVLQVKTKKNSAISSLIFSRKISVFYFQTQHYIVNKQCIFVVCLHLDFCFTCIFNIHYYVRFFYISFIYATDFILLFPYACTSFYFYYFFYFFVQYELEIMATDTLNEANAKVIIFIRDVNDLPPVFDETSYTAHIFEEEIPIKSILQVSFTSFF